MKYCEKCGQGYNENNSKQNFCISCGAKLKKTQTAPDLSIISNEYRNLYGLWEVSTERDEEGRTMRSLGVYEGYIDDIAIHLQKECFWKLNFRAIKISKIKDSLESYNGKPINLSLNYIFKNLNDVNSNIKEATLKELFKNRPVSISLQGNSDIIIKGKVE